MACLGVFLQQILIAAILVSTVLPSSKILGIGAEGRELSQESVNSNTMLLECPPTCTTDYDCLSVKGCGYGCVNKGAYKACSGVTARIGAEQETVNSNTTLLECPPTCTTDDDCLSVKGCGYGCVNKGAYKACSGVTARIGAEAREFSQETVNSNTTLLECPPTCTTDDDCLSVKGCGYGCVNKGAYKACSGV